MDKMHLKIVEETEWDAAGEVCDPSCPKHDHSLFWVFLSECISVKAWPVRRCDTCVRILSVKNVQFTVISLSINVTNSREHFHFCIKVCPDRLCVRFKIPNEYRRVHLRQTDGTQSETINRICSAQISIVLNYLLLKVNLRFKSQHAV